MKKSTIKITSIGVAVALLCSSGFVLKSDDPAKDLEYNVSYYISNDKPTSCIGDVLEKDEITSEDIKSVDNLGYYIELSEMLNDNKKLNDITVTQEEVEQTELLSPKKIKNLMEEEKDNSKFRDVEEIRKQLAIQERLVNLEIYNTGYYKLQSIIESTLEATLLDINHQGAEYLDYVELASYVDFNEGIIEKNITTNEDQPLYTSKYNTNISNLFKYNNYLKHKTMSHKEIDGDLEDYTANELKKQTYNEDRNHIIKNGLKYLKNVLNNEYTVQNNIGNSKEIIKAKTKKK